MQLQFPAGEVRIGGVMTQRAREVQAGRCVGCQGFPVLATVHASKGRAGVGLWLAACNAIAEFASLRRRGDPSCASGFLTLGVVSRPGPERFKLWLLRIRSAS